MRRCLFRFTNCFYFLAYGILSLSWNQECLGNGDANLLNRGEMLYRTQCANCHGSDGEGVSGEFETALTGDLTVDGLASVIHKTMPAGSPDDCVGEDALAIATWAHRTFYGEMAQMRLNPPRLSLARLTGEQLRQSLSDLFAHHVGIAGDITERGLNGLYFDAANFKGESKKIERVDATVDFSFALEGPGGEIKPDEYSIQWRGGLLAERSGQYEIVVNSTCSFTCQLGHYGRMFIDNHVQSGDKTEFRKTVRLTGGRVTPFQIKFRQRKRKTEQPPAEISLAWVPPGGIEQVIPTRNLVPKSVPAVFNLQTWLPPDDRSYGFERGISIDREWDESTTKAALEFATAASSELWPRYAKQKKAAEDNRDVLHSFLVEFAEVVFRGPLDDETRELYIDGQIRNIADDTEAIRRVTLAVLKSPRFLYPTLDSGRSHSQRSANRLALTLFDSLPSDGWLQNRITKHKINSPEAIREVATRMVTDRRTQTKTRDFIFEWLNLRHIQDLSKDIEKYPGYSPSVVNAMRDSLGGFIDDVFWSEHSDYRLLFSGRATFASDSAATFYSVPAQQDDLPTNSETASAPEGEKVPELGILSHPYLMSGLAYRDSTSPIHRGVFLIRYLLGRTMRPPNAAFTPLSPDLHPDLTTRDRVQLQTSPIECQICHEKINGLGFVLENFDAVGRYRTKERSQSIDPTGIYTTRSGEDVQFDGPSSLAKFVATSDDAHRAFVERMFLHFVKQPPGAWGPSTLNHLTDSFKDHDFNMRNLLTEIAIVASAPPQS